MMKGTTLLWQILLFLLFFSCTTNATQHLDCGFVLDGDVLNVDDDSMSIYDKYHANWHGFGEDVQYEWAIISEDQASATIKSVGDLSDIKTRCRKESGIDGEPDTLNWTPLGTNVNSASTSLPLIDGKTYYVLLHAFIPSSEDSEEISLFSNSNGSIINHRDARVKRIAKERTERSVSPKHKPSQNETKDIENDDDAGFEGDDIAGIVVGCVSAGLILLAIILGILSFIFKWNSSDKYDD